MTMAMDVANALPNFLFGSVSHNRTVLFSKALKSAKYGKVVYIMKDELDELPELTQDLKSVNKHYMKMISFLYVKSLELLIQTISNLNNWQHLPSTIILDNLDEYCRKDKIQDACGIVALLIDTVNSCSKDLQNLCKLYISVNKSDVGDDYCNTLENLYS